MRKARLLTPNRDGFHGWSVHALLQQLQGFQIGIEAHTGQPGDGLMESLEKCMTVFAHVSDTFPQPQAQLPK